MGGFLYKETRSSIGQNLNIPNCKLQLSRGNIKYQGSVDYNKAPLGIRQTESFVEFKGQMMIKHRTELEYP